MVVVGYGTQKQEDIDRCRFMVNMGDVEMNTVPNVVNCHVKQRGSLQGAMPGTGFSQPGCCRSGHSWKSFNIRGNELYL